MLKAIPISHTSRTLADTFQNQNVWLVFAFLCFGYGVTTYIQDNFIMTKEIYYNTLGEQLALERIDELLAKKANWKFINYILIPLTILIQTALIAICISCGTLVMEFKVSFISLFKIVLKASVIFLLGKMLLLFIYLFADIKVYNDLETYNKFALSGFIDSNAIPTWLMYPLSILSIFEALFWLILARGISRLVEKPLWTSFNIIAVTYGIGLLLWILFIIFLQLNFI